MAKLSAFKTDSKAVAEGEWVRVGEDYDDLEIRTRGMTDAYTNARDARHRKAAVGFGGDVSKLPVEIRRRINIDCLATFLVLDVRNLTDDDGAPVTVDAFKDLLSDPDYDDLVTACYRAASQVGKRKADDLADAAGNFVPASVGS